MLQLNLSFERAEFRLEARGEWGPGVTGICGASGAGKTTLLALLAGLIAPTQGSLQFQSDILVDTTRALFVPPWQRHFGVVFQEHRLFPHLSVRGNLLYGARRLPSADRQHSLESICDLLEISALLERRTAQLSGGERQRVALGRALLYSPRLLLLDEPLSSLDERLKQQILPFLRRVREELRLPMIYVSHDRRELDYLADRVWWMAGGQLLERPPAQSLGDGQNHA